jgi:hypothetical protein
MNITLQTVVFRAEDVQHVIVEGVLHVINNNIYLILYVIVKMIVMLIMENNVVVHKDKAFMINKIGIIELANYVQHFAIFVK